MIKKMSWWWDQAQTLTLLSQPIKGVSAVESSTEVLRPMYGWGGGMYIGLTACPVTWAYMVGSADGMRLGSVDIGSNWVRWTLDMGIGW